MQWAYQTLAAFVGEGQEPRTPLPSATKLTGHTEKQTVGNATTTRQWTFQADVSGG
jgi:hypothetical protein